MASIQIVGAGTSARVQFGEAFTCWVKRRWVDDWRYVPYLFPDSSTESAWPTDSEASLTWEYGVFARLWNRGAAFTIPINLDNWYVAIVTHTIFGAYISWIGVVVAQSLVEEGIHSTGLPQGNQILQAKGLEYLLDRRIVMDSYVEGLENTVRIKNARKFNKANAMGARVSGNRSNEIGPEGTWRFSSDGQVWRNSDICSYLLTYFQPNEPEFLITGQFHALRNIRQEWDFAGATVRDALKELISRKRGLGVKVRTDGVGPVYLEVFSLSQQALHGADGVSIPANPQQLIVVINDSPHIQMELEINSMNAYDALVVESQETIRTTATFTVEGGTLEPGWTEEEETDYTEGTENDRAGDLLSRVFSVFRVPLLLPGNVLVPGVDNLARISLSSSGSAWLHDLAFLRWLPWLQEGGAAGTEPDYREPFALIVNPTLPEAEGPSDPSEWDAGEWASAQWMYLDRLEQHDFEHGALRTLDRQLGIEIRSKANHVFALNHWSGEGSETAPQLDYVGLLATLNLPTDQKMRVVLPIRSGNSGAATGRQLYIQVPGVEGWVVAPGTVYDVDSDGALVYWNGGAADIVRDDTAILRSVALMAWVWYGQQRAAATFTIQNQIPHFQVGSLIRTAISGLGAERIGTVVTSITRLYQENEQVVTTGYCELDPVEFGGLSGR